MSSDEDWITPQDAAELLGKSLTAVYINASRLGWETKRLGRSDAAGVLYWLDDVREELPNHGRALSVWDD